MKISFTICACAIAGVNYAQSIDFEGTIPSNFSVSAGTLSMANEHYRLGSQSVKWAWTANAMLEINNPGINAAQVLDVKYNTTALWVYNDTASSSSLRFEFLNAANAVQYYFDFKLNFKGWRRIMRSYLYDMHKISGASGTIPKLRIKAPVAGSGDIFFDDWQYTIARTTRVATRQMPDISGSYSDTSFLFFDRLIPDIPVTAASASEISELTSIRNKLKIYFAGSTPTSGQVTTATNYYDSLHITVNGNEIKGDLTTPMLANTQLMVLARHYYHTGNLSSREMALNLIWLLNDQGYAGGSDLKYNLTGYETKYYYMGLSLLYDEYSSAFKDKMKDAVQWAYMMGVQWQSNWLATNHAINSDYVYNYLIYHLAAITLGNNNNDTAVRDLKGLKRYLDNAMVPTSGTNDWIKPDGTGFHHNTHYNAYMYSYNLFIDVLDILKSTEFFINQSSYEKFRDAVYAFELMANGNQYANSLCGRHPFSLNVTVNQASLKKLAYLGGSVYGTLADPKIAGMYTRLWSDDPVLTASYPPEVFPTGFYQFNYSPIGIYRKDNWVATIHGMNNVFWGAEHFVDANWFGRYQSYGALEIFFPKGSNASGYSVSGYNWVKPNGTTTKEIPFSSLSTHGVRWNEMANASSFFAAALRFNKISGSNLGNGGEYGMYGFDFQQRATLDSSFKFKKSYFCFDDFILCLGSNINSTDASSKVTTNLFQLNLNSASDSIVVNGVPQNTFPYTAVLKAGKNWVIDQYHTGYFMNTVDSIHITKQLQISPIENSDTITAFGNFSSVFIDHGKAPHDKNYEYVIIPNSTPASMSVFVANYQNGHIPYQIIQQDNMAHVVKHLASGAVGYIIYGTGVNFLQGDLLNADKPCMVMMNKTNNAFKITVVNPDINIINNLTTPSPVKITIKGVWPNPTLDPGVSVFSTTSNSTTFLVNCKDGKPYDITLYDVTSISEMQPEQAEIRIYPNPAHEKIIIEAHPENSNFGVRLFSIQGVLVRERKYAEPHAEMDVKNLGSGIYILELSNSKGTVYKKMVKE